jgi:hypothetical protein
MFSHALYKKKKLHQSTHQRAEDIQIQRATKLALALLIHNNKKLQQNRDSFSF